MQHYILSLLLLCACGQLPAAPSEPAPELPCNGIDDDGDGVVDPDDLDHDGVGTCNPDRFDCNDLDERIGPHRLERCNGVDDDCDGALTPAELDRDHDGQADCAADCDDEAGDRTTFDVDNDGWTSCGGDCDDGAADVHPYAEELCNDRDDDCDGTRSVNEQDMDGDGWSWCAGDCSPSNPHRAPADFDGDGFYGCAEVPDCDDTRADARPGAPERCNGLDDDCDGVADEDAVDLHTWFLDEDSDGYGAVEVLACVAPPGATAAAGDCDDQDPLRHPAMPERCDGLDQDCDNIVDELAPRAEGWRDLDNDGFGDSSAPVVACVLPPGTALIKGDCDDTQPLVHPGARDLCNEVDDDCDGKTDEDPSSGLRWFLDRDGDGHGDEARSTTACALPDGYSPSHDDCDDGEAERHPGHAELCNGVDDDCDGETDEDGVNGAGWFFDVDGDGWGGAPSTACGAAPGLTERRRDCDDHASGVYPGATERCDGVDEDCDGEVDDGAIEQLLWHPDSDGDGFGAEGSGQLACVRPAHHVTDGTDCDDASSPIHPGGTEVCNRKDDDCDGEVDEEAIDAVPWWLDRDGDTWGDPGWPTLTQCARPVGYTARAGDCDDVRDTINPDAQEVCDRFDNDCSGVVNDVDDPPSWFEDADGDSYGNPYVKVEQCFAPDERWVENDDDCDDDSTALHPGQTEHCDGVDEDCDGVVDNDAIDRVQWYPDADGDGRAARLGEILACEAPLGGTAYYATPGDCDDADPQTYLGAPELCDRRDNDCDLHIDEDAIEARTWYLDTDGDGYGVDRDTIQRCRQPDGYADASGDCNEADPEINPGADELCTARIDENCDGDFTLNATNARTWYRDLDGDGVVGPNVTGIDCRPIPGAVESPDSLFDCDDGDARRAPNLPELCTLDVDENCDPDGRTDDVEHPPRWYADSDGDGFGGAVWLEQCARPDNYVGTSTDCADGDNEIHPDAIEVCDSLDNDCDNDIDEEVPDMPIWWLDNDNDGYVGAVSTAACTAPPGYRVQTVHDCDDNNNPIHPTAPETCDGVDEDCNGLIDDGELAQNLYFPDSDGDGYGHGDGTLRCGPAPGEVDRGGDCDESDVATHADAPEDCEEADRNCNGVPDDGAQGTTPYYLDGDADGYGAADATTPVFLCVSTTGYASNQDDCNDALASINPAAEETCDNADQNCDGSVDELVTREVWPDLDGDGYGDDEGDAFYVCPDEIGAHADNHTDCDDSDDEVYPGSDVCHPGADTNCDGARNYEGPAGAEFWCPSTCGDGVCDPGEAGGADCQPELPLELISTCGLLHDGTCDEVGQEWSEAPGIQPDLLLPRGGCVDLTGHVQINTCPELLLPDGRGAETWTVCFPDLYDPAGPADVNTLPDPCGGDPSCVVVDGCGEPYVISAVCP
jgi:hypothetical protein